VRAVAGHSHTARVRACPPPRSVTRRAMACGKPVASGESKHLGRARHTHHSDRALPLHSALLLSTARPLSSPPALLAKPSESGPHAASVPRRQQRRCPGRWQLVRRLGPTRTWNQELESRRRAAAATRSTDGGQLLPAREQLARRHWRLGQDRRPDCRAIMTPSR
jgi:hypothetical protein